MKSAFISLTTAALLAGTCTALARQVAQTTTATTGGPIIQTATDAAPSAPTDVPPPAPNESVGLAPAASITTQQGQSKTNTATAGPTTGSGPATQTADSSPVKHCANVGPANGFPLKVAQTSISSWCSGLIRSHMSEPGQEAMYLQSGLGAGDLPHVTSPGTHSGSNAGGDSVMTLSIAITKGIRFEVEEDTCVSNFLEIINGCPPYKITAGAPDLLKYGGTLDVEQSLYDTTARFTVDIAA